MRGKAVCNADCLRTGRITPAYAGKSSTSCRWKSGRKDHPRVCGEKLMPTIVYYGQLGSPPRMRGKATGPPRSCGPGGITPAYAGKSSIIPHPQGVFKDHPRVCGEKYEPETGPWRYLGSPPRMRGKASGVRSFRWAVGITPAYAGKSILCPAHFGVVWDHPRVCGEKLVCTFQPFLYLGSPPRMRGKGFGAAFSIASSGITPAYAGKRLKRSHRIGHFSCILCLFHSVLHRASASGGSRAGPCAPPCLPAQNAVPV